MPKLMTIHTHRTDDPTAAAEQAREMYRRWKAAGGVKYDEWYETTLPANGKPCSVLVTVWQGWEYVHLRYTRRVNVRHYQTREIESSFDEAVRVRIRLNDDRVKDWHEV
jgi:hypothetical protein